jgi:predicted transcriptional regulator
MKVHTILTEISRPVQMIAGDCSIEAAIELMAAKRAGALIVTDNDRPVGIFAKRDVFHCLAKDKNIDLSATTLLSALKTQLITAEPGDEVDQIVAVMRKAHVRHIPVMENKKILGMLQLTDLFEHQIESLTDEINQLNDYIEDLHEAGRD